MRGHPIGHLGLHHHHGEAQRIELLEAAQHHRRRHTVWKVGDQGDRRAKRGCEVFEGHVHRVSRDDLEVATSSRGLRQHGKHPRVPLDRDHGAGRAAQRQCQRADARTDLEDRFVARESCETHDATDDVVIHEKMLAQRLAGVESVSAQHGRSGPWCREA